MQASGSSVTDPLQYDYAAQLGIYNATTGELVKDSDGETIGVHIRDMCNFLQEKFPAGSNNYTYRTKVLTKYSIGDVEKYLAGPLSFDKVAIIRVDEPQRLNYYPNSYNSGAHYIVLSSYDYSTKEATVLDPHYSSKYYGKHTVSLAELQDLVYAEYNLWVCTYTNVN